MRQVDRGHYVDRAIPRAYAYQVGRPSAREPPPTTSSARIGVHCAVRRITLLLLRHLVRDTRAPSWRSGAEHAASSTAASHFAPPLGHRLRKPTL